MKVCVCKRAQVPHALCQVLVEYCFLFFFHPANTHHLMYAENLVILAPSVAGLSKMLRICESFGESNDIIFNQRKSASLYFISKMLKGAHLLNVYLNGVLVEQVDSVKYLGHFLTCEISDDIDIRRQCRVLNVRGNILCRTFHMCN